MAKTVRQHARERGALDGADAQALEGALCLAERDIATRDARIAELEKTNAALRESYDDLTEQRSRLSRALAEATETPWVWLADGTDDLETMGDEMAVMIQAGQLRAIIGGSKARIAELEADNAEAWKVAHEYRDEAALNHVRSDNYLERIAELERERDAIHEALRKHSLLYIRGCGVSMQCKICDYWGNPEEPERHREGCLAAPLDNGSSATASLPDRD